MCWTRGQELSRWACYSHLRAISSSQTAPVPISTNAHTRAAIVTAGSTASSLGVSVSEHQSICCRRWHADTSRGGQRSLFLFLTLVRVRLAGSALLHSYQGAWEPGSTEDMHQVLEVPGQLAVLMVSEETKAHLGPLSSPMQPGYDTCMGEKLNGQHAYRMPCLAQIAASWVSRNEEPSEQLFQVSSVNVLMQRADRWQKNAVLGQESEGGGSGKSSC